MLPLLHAGPHPGGHDGGAAGRHVGRKYEHYREPDEYVEYERGEHEYPSDAGFNIDLRRFFITVKSSIIDNNITCQLA